MHRKRRQDGKECYDFKTPADALFALFEELYDSESSINDERIDGASYWLCKHFGLNTDQLAFGLCVEHKRARFSDNLKECFFQLTKDKGAKNV